MNEYSICLFIWLLAWFLCTTNCQMVNGSTAAKYTPFTTVGVKEKYWKLKYIIVYHFELNWTELNEQIKLKCKLAPISEMKKERKRGRENTRKIMVQWYRVELKYISISNSGWGNIQHRVRYAIAQIKYLFITLKTFSQSKRYRVTSKPPDMCSFSFLLSFSHGIFMLSVPWERVVLFYWLNVL